MWRTNLKIVATVLVTLGIYTGISNVIPQVESEVPEAVEVSADLSVEELVSVGEEIYFGAGGCEACHGTGTRAPELVGEIGQRCGERVPEMDCKEYLHESLVDPNAFVVEGFQPIMPDMEAQLSGGQIWALVAYLQAQGGEVTVTSADLESSGGESAAGESGGGGTAGGTGQAAAAGGGGEGAGAEALVRQYGCLACHQLGGEGGATAPPFEAIRERAFGRDYLRRSILEPDADTASGYEQDYSQFAGTMMANFDERLSDDELATIVEWLAAGAGEGS